MDTIHTSRQVTSSKTGRSGNISGKCLQESGQPIPARPFLCYRTEESCSGTVLPTDLWPGTLLQPWIYRDLHAAAIGNAFGNNLQGSCASRSISIQTVDSGIWQFRHIIRSLRSCFKQGISITKRITAKNPYSFRWRPEAFAGSGSKELFSGRNTGRRDDPLVHRPFLYKE